LTIHVNDFNCLRTSKTFTIWNDEYVPAHNYVDTVINSTCTEVGYTLHQCACGYSYEDSLVPALGHDYVQSGETYTCSRCGDSYSDHIHSYTATVIAPTCTEQGYTIHSCACGHSYQSNITEALGHVYEESNTTGGIVYTCTRCGDSYSEHTHTYSSTTVAATCTTGGYILHTCTCGYSYQSNATEPLGHDYHADNTDVGTVYTCSRCGDSYMDHTHSYTNTVVEPTCTEQGYTLHTCECGYSYQDTQTDALGHNYVGSNTQVGTIYTCTRCGDSYTGHTHTYTETVVAATCTTDGYTLHSCACGYDYQSDIVAALGHNYQESTEGSDTVYTCTRCGDSYSGHTHSYTETVVEPTCTEQGYTLYECSCGHSYEDDIVDALGHDWVVVEETETMRVRYCDRCYITVTEEISTPIDPVEPPVEYSLRSVSAPSEDCGGTERVLVSTVTEEHSYVYASGKLLRESITTTDADGNVGTQTLDFQYDNIGFPYALTYINGTAQPVTYYYITNMQGDVVYLVDEQGQEVAYYTYDPFGKVLSAEGDMAEVNPLRYRGYFYDETTGFYYLQSRYYDPAICRYINADSYLSTGQGFLGYNAFAYCANNPVNYTDSSGNFFDTIFDVISIGFSIADVIANPTDPWAWAGLAGDLIDLVPFVSGVGETVKAIGAVADVVDAVDDAYDAAKAIDRVDDAFDAIDDIHDSTKMLDLDDCFIAGTLVATEDGNMPIEEIEIGDYVWAWDEETGEVSLKRVVETYINETVELVHVFVSGEEITTTTEHPFYLPVKGWIPASELAAGDALLLLNGEYAVVEAVHQELLEEPVKTYNFQVEGWHTYYVSALGVLVHNSCTLGFPEVITTQEVKAPTQISMRNATDVWDDYLGPNQTSYNRFTGKYDADRIFSEDGTRSIRFGNHEMNSIGANSAHFHFEIWGYDPVDNTVVVRNTLQRLKR